jgi:hypothetical protein
MIVEYRNKAAVWLILSIILTGVGGVALYLRVPLRPHDDPIWYKLVFFAVFFTISLASWISWTATGWFFLLANEIPVRIKWIEVLLLSGPAFVAGLLPFVVASGLNYFKVFK